MITMGWNSFGKNCAESLAKTASLAVASHFSSVQYERGKGWKIGWKTKDTKTNCTIR
jgi:hypothetical protein